jgi:guanine deaminase
MGVNGDNGYQKPEASRRGLRVYKTGDVLHQTSSRKTMTRIQVTVYEGRFIHSVEEYKLEYFSGCVGVDEQGSIVFVDREAANASEAVRKQGISEASVEIINESQTETGFFFPGFFDTHIHAPQFPNNGIFGDSTLLDWLNKYTFPMEASLKDTQRAKEVYSKVIETTLANGTTTASYFATNDVEATNILADEALRQSQRAFIGRVCMVRNTPDYYQDASDEAAHESDLKVVDYVTKLDPKRELVCPILTPRFAPTCTESGMKWQGKVAVEKDLPIQTHLSENENEIKWVGELYPNYKSYTDVYDKCGLLTERTILAHCVHLSEEERTTLVQRKSGVSHCPVSNSSLTSGECPVREYIDKGIKVSLGTDCSGGFSPSILSIARNAQLVSNHRVMKSKENRQKLSFEEVLSLATLGGANVCNLANKLGNFQVGKKWDAQFVDLSKGAPRIFSWAIPEDQTEKLKYLAQKWLFNGDDRNTTRVWVNGKLVVKK